MDHSLPIDADPIQAASAQVTGRRPETPQFTDDPMLDRLYSVTLALVSELAVTRTRLDTVERLLAERAVLPTADVEGFKPDVAQATARAEWQQAYLERVLRGLLNEPA